VDSIDRLDAVGQPAQHVHEVPAVGGLKHQVAERHVRLMLVVGQDARRVDIVDIEHDGHLQAEPPVVLTHEAPPPVMYFEAAEFGDDAGTAPANRRAIDERADGVMPNSANQRNRSLPASRRTRLAGLTRG